MRCFTAIGSNLMWPDWKDRQIELEDKADFFVIAGYPMSGHLITDLAQLVARETPIDSLNQSVETLRRTWETEFIQGKQFRQSLVGIIGGLIFSSVKSGVLEQELPALLPVISELSDNIQNFKSVQKAFKPFRKQGDIKMQFYEKCILYMWNVEGVFDQAIKVLYLLVSALNGDRVSFGEVNIKLLSELRSAFQGIVGRQAGILFCGLNSGVRNSIAHCRFRYNEHEETMRFLNFDPRTRKTTYDETFTLEEFMELYTKLDDIWHIFQFILFLLRIGTLIFTEEVPRVAQDLLMPTARV